MPNRRPTTYRHRQQRTFGWLLAVCLVPLGGWLQYRWVAKKNAEFAINNPILTRTRKIPCYQCEGRQIYHEPGNPALKSPCAVCFGVGHREILTPFADRELCPRCNGMGRESLGANQAATCGICEGWGQVIVSSYRESEPVLETLEALPPPPSFQLRP